MPLLVSESEEANEEKEIKWKSKIPNAIQKKPEEVINSEWIN